MAGGEPVKGDDVRVPLLAAGVIDGEAHLVDVVDGVPKSPPSSPKAHASTRPLTLWPLVVLVFFEVSGGPFGTEDGVAAGGPLLTMLGFLILPFVWSIPEALITAELSTAFPENSGYVAWVTAAFGPFWGFQEGLWSWLSGVTDNSLYPVMLAANLSFFFPVLKEEGGWPRSLFLVGMSLLLSYMNYRGLTVVGHSLLASCVIILVPFLLLAALAAPHINPANWTIIDWGHVNWVDWINVMFWNLNYWDSVSTLAGEVRDPSTTFPRAMLLAVGLVVTMYLLPTLAALGVMPPDPTGKSWKLGFYETVAEHVGGHWLAVWVLAAAAFSQVGQFQAEMASDSYQLQGMAERGFLPLVLAKRSKHGTPTLGIILSSMGVLILARLSFVEIITLLNAIYCLAELLEFVAFIWLRIKQPDLPRPYKIPLPTWGCVLLLLPSTILLCVVIAMNFYQLNTPTMVATLGAILLGAVMYPLLQVARKRGWCKFADMHFGVGNVWGPPAPVSYSWPEHNVGVVGCSEEGDKDDWRAEPTGLTPAPSAGLTSSLTHRPTGGDSSSITPRPSALGSLAELADDDAPSDNSRLLVANGMVNNNTHADGDASDRLV